LRRSLPEFHSIRLDRKESICARGANLARFERDFRTAAEAPLTLDELIALLGNAEGDARSREDAIACYLSGSDGWREAVKRLGGAFAEKGSELRNRKVD
jgi:hypothetical protein